MAEPRRPSPIWRFVRLYVLGWTAVGLLGFGIAFVSTSRGSGVAAAIANTGWPLAWGLLGIQMSRSGGRYFTGARDRLNLALAIPGVPTLFLLGTLVFGGFFASVIRNVMKFLQVPI